MSLLFTLCGEIWWAGSMSWGWGRQKDRQADKQALRKTGICRQACDELPLWLCPLSSSQPHITWQTGVNRIFTSPWRHGSQKPLFTLWGQRTFCADELTREWSPK
jgi:hypothetical protein